MIEMVGEGEHPRNLNANSPEIRMYDEWVGTFIDRHNRACG